MVGSREDFVGKPKRIGEPYCRNLGQLSGTGILYGANGYGYSEKWLELKGLELSHDEIDELNVRVAEGAQGLMSRNLTTGVRAYETDVILDLPCPSDQTKRCGRLCIQNAIDSIHNTTDASHANDTEPEVAKESESEPINTQPKSLNGTLKSNGGLPQTWMRMYDK